MTRISAGTITDLTASPQFHGGAANLNPPTTEEMIADLRGCLVGARLAEFEKLIANVPQGFRLTPVFFMRSVASSNRSVKTEYLLNTRSAFFHYLAENHADDLLRMGLPRAAVRRMRHYLEPADEKGNYYALSVDHIIERSCTGQWSRRKIPDIDRHPDDAPRYPVNHFGNLMLMTDALHDYKNHLGDVQRAGRAIQGAPRWVLMLTPERDDVFAGFVSPAQDPASPYSGLVLRPEGFKAQLTQTAYVLKLALHQLRRYEKNIDVKRFRAHLQNNVPGAPPAEPLMKTFNHYAARGSDARRVAGQMLKPAIAEIHRCLADMLDIAERAEPRQYRDTMRNFARFFQGGDLRDFRQLIAGLPFRESTAALQEFERMGEKLKAFELAHPRPRQRRLGGNTGAAPSQT